MKIEERAKLRGVKTETCKGSSSVCREESSSFPAGAALSSETNMRVRNPLEVIALSLCLVEAMTVAVLMWGRTIENLLQIPLVLFVTLFPVAVMGVFVWLISRHSDLLYGPSDFRRDEAFVEFATRRKARTAALLSLAQTKGGEKELSDEKLDTILDTALGEVRTPARNRILWVDDRPENNVWERKMFRAEGLEISLALNTQQALAMLSGEEYGLVISDMGRAEGPREGYVLLDEMRARGDKTPLVFYASSGRPEHRQETREHGGQGCTNNSVELYELTKVLLTSP